MSLVASERTLLALFKYKVDPRGVRDVKQSADDIEEKLMELESAFYKLTRPLNDIAMVAGQFEALGFEIQDYGRRVTDSMQMFAEEYVQSMEGADATSKEWLKTTQELEAAQAKFGQTSAQAILPMLKLQAQIVKTASDFAQKYPDIANIAFGIGTAVVLASSLSNAVAKGIRMVADAKLVALELQRVIAAKMMRDAANKQIIAGGLMKKAADQQMVSDLRGKVMQRGSLLGRAKEGLTGLAGGAKGALAGLGVSGALSVGAIVASLVAIGVAVNKFGDKIEKGEKQVKGKWTGYLAAAEKSGDSAVVIMDKYRAAQERVSKAHDEGGVIADIFVNKQKIMHADLQELTRAVFKSAKSYEDYQTAIERFNDTLEDGEKPIRVMTREHYNYRRELERVREELKAGTASVKEYGRIMMDQGNLMDRIMGQTIWAMGEIQESKALEGLLDDWLEYQNERERIFAQGNEEQIAAWTEFKNQWVAKEEETGAARTAAIDSYQSDILQLDLETGSERERILKNMGQELAQIEESVASDREQTMQSYHDDMVDAEEQYYKDRAESAAEFGEDTRRAEQDHQKEMRRMREDSELRQVDAIRSRDALALIEERRSYEKDRRRSEEDYAIEMSRRSADFAKQMVQMEKAFVEQQAAREEQFRKELKALEDRLRQEEAMRQKAGEEELATLEAGRVNQLRSLYDQKEEELGTIEDENEKQGTELKKGLNDRLREARAAQRQQLLDARSNFDKRRQEAGFWNGRELDQYRTFRDQSLGTLREFVRKANVELHGLRVPQSSGLGYASGGYAGYGVHRLGEQGREFVLSNPTTKAAERLAGGRLTQSNLLSAMAGNGGSPQVNNSFTFQGRLSEDEKEEYKAIAYEQTLNALNDVMKGIS